MDVSIVIVTYNVRPFIKLCLDSIYVSQGSVEYEVILVDNHSTDGSIEFLKNYPRALKVIENSENRGFSKACNQGAQMATGTHLIFLNPDTLIKEDLISRAFSYYKSLDNLGILGGRLYDGGLNYLPESKRKFPGFWNGVGRILHIDRVFSGSKLDYYDRRDPETDHDVEVLTGAFMMISKRVFVEVGAFDERYFMYGEDIDISLKITALGYMNHYLSALELIHFKGESTVAKSWSYYERFYGAMIIYMISNTFPKGAVLKHIFAFAIRTFGVIKYIIDRIRRPLFDYLMLLFILILSIRTWAAIYHHDASYYPEHLWPLWFLMPTVWIHGLGFFGRYMRTAPYYTRQILSGLGLGTLLMIAIYALLPEYLRFSRMLLVIPPALYGCALILLKDFRSKVYSNSVIWSDQALQEEEQSLIRTLFSPFTLVKNPSKDLNGDTQLIIDNSTISISDILKYKVHLKSYHRITYWDRSEGLFFNSYDGRSKGLSYDALSRYNLSNPIYLMHKRVFDILISIILLPLLPIICIVFRSIRPYYNWLSVVYHRMSIVGYHQGSDRKLLPPINPGLITNESLYKEQLYRTDQMDQDYALHYTIWKDFLCCTLHIFGLIIALNGRHEGKDKSIS